MNPLKNWSKDRWAAIVAALIAFASLFGVEIPTTAGTTEPAELTAFAALGVDSLEAATIKPPFVVDESLDTEYSPNKSCVWNLLIKAEAFLVNRATVSSGPALPDGGYAIDVDRHPLDGYKVTVAGKFDSIEDLLDAALLAAEKKIGSESQYHIWGHWNPRITAVVSLDSALACRLVKPLPVKDREQADEPLPDELD